MGIDVVRPGAPAVVTGPTSTSEPAALPAVSDPARTGVLMPSDGVDRAGTLRDASAAARPPIAPPSSTELARMSSRTRAQFETAWTSADEATRTTLLAIVALPPDQATRALTLLASSPQSGPTLGLALSLADRSAAMSALSSAIARGETAVLDGALRSDNPGSAIETYNRLTSIEGIDPAVVRTLVQATGTGRAGPGSEGLVMPAAAERAAQALSRMTESERGAFAALLSAQPGESHRATLLRALAARADSFVVRADTLASAPLASEPHAGASFVSRTVALQQLTRFSERIATLSPPDMVAATTAIRYDGGEEIGRQVFEDSCGPTTIAVARAEVDPIFCMEMQDPTLMAMFQLLDQDVAGGSLVWRSDSPVIMAARISTHMATLPPEHRAYGRIFSEGERTAIAYARDPARATREPSPAEQQALQEVWQRNNGAFSTFAAFLSAVRGEEPQDGYPFGEAAVRGLVMLSAMADSETLANPNANASDRAGAAERMFARIGESEAMRLHSSADLLSPEAAARWAEGHAYVRGLLSPDAPHLAIYAFMSGLSDADQAAMRALASGTNDPTDADRALIARFIAQLAPDELTRLYRQVGSSASAPAALAQDVIAAMRRPGTYMRDYFDQLSVATGRTYEETAVVTYAGAAIASRPTLPFATINESLRTGIDIAVRVANPRTDGEGHYLLLTDVQTTGTPPTTRYLVHDPWSGRSAWADEDALQSGAFLQSFTPGDDRVITHLGLAHD